MKTRQLLFFVVTLTINERVHFHFLFVPVGVTHLTFFLNEEGSKTHESSVCLKQSEATFALSAVSDIHAASFPVARLNEVRGSRESMVHFAAESIRARDSVRGGIVRVLTATTRQAGQTR